MATNNIKDSSTITRHDFPLGFVFGTGTAAYQVEGWAKKGGRGISIWDNFCWNTPERVDDGSNGNVACDMYNLFREDIKAMKRMGLDAYRFSISWPRVLPCGRRAGGVNREGIAYYNEVIDTCIANGIEPFVTLFHWDLPQCLEEEYNGFLTTDPTITIMPDFVEFAELCFWEFGDRVKNWVTLNEPSTYSDHAYASCTFPPSLPGQEEPPEPQTAMLDIAAHGHRGFRRPKKTFSSSYDRRTRNIRTNSFKGLGDSQGYHPTDAYLASKNLLLAHGAASQSYRTKFQAQQEGKIGITLVSHWFVPLDDTSNDDIAAAQRAVDFLLGWFLDPIMIGNYPQFMLDNAKENLTNANAYFTPDQIQLLNGSLDFLGLNYYTTFYAYNDPNPTVRPGYHHDQYLLTTGEKDGVPIGTPTGTWEYVVPEGIYNLVKHVTTERYASQGVKVPPIVITENGMGENFTGKKLTPRQACQDDLRMQYHQEHLAYLQKAVSEGMNVTGYFVWSWCDNFEWANGYDYRFGINYTDYKNNLDRSPKDSAIWLAQFLKKMIKVQSRKRLGKLRDANEENDSEKRLKTMEDY